MPCSRAWRLPHTRWGAREATTTSTAKSGRSTSVARRRSPRLTRLDSLATTFSGAVSRFSFTTITVTARTSAVKRPRCWNRSKAKRDFRVSSLRSPRTTVCTANRRRSTTPRRSRRCRGSSATAAKHFSISACPTMVARRSFPFAATSSVRATTKSASARLSNSCSRWRAACAAAGN